MVRTGGRSSVFSPRSGFAAKLANTPSFAEVIARLDPVVVGVVNDGSNVGLRGWPGVDGAFCDSALDSARNAAAWLESTGSTLARINRCLSSGSSSSSESSPSPKVSARV